MIRIYIIVLQVVLLAACNNQTSSQQLTVACKMPRPEMCAMNYQPVCANLLDGQQKTYSNACSACSDDQVTNYLSLACSQNKNTNKDIKKTRF